MDSGGLGIASQFIIYIEKLNEFVRFEQALKHCDYLLNNYN